VKDLGKDKGSPMADKPLSLSAAENTPEAVKPQSPRSAEDLPEGTKSPSPKAAEGTQKVKKPLSRRQPNKLLGPTGGKTSRENSPTPNPQKHGLGAAADAPTGEGLAQPRVKEVPRSSP
jgi:hypothetical protein